MVDPDLYYTVSICQIMSLAWPFSSRLLHSHNLLAVALSVEHGTWPSVACVVSCMNGLSKYWLVNYHIQCIMNLGITTIFQRSLTVSLHSPNGRQMPAIRAVQGDCERVYIRSVEWLSVCWILPINHQLCCHGYHGQWYVHIYQIRESCGQLRCRWLVFKVSK